jgi:hypothetical protein
VPTEPPAGDAATEGADEVRGAAPAGPAARKPTSPTGGVRFAHNSERQFARLLDFYGITWEYEPRTFTLEWDRVGRPVQAFSPDFYLPAYDLYIEITTLNQKLVTRKNRKARRLRELYPDIRIKLFYQRDYLNLLVKYGLEEPSQAMVDDSVEPLPLRFDIADDIGIGDDIDAFESGGKAVGEGPSVKPRSSARRRRKPA